MSAVRRFWGELRRRRVIGSTGAYVVASFGIIEAADVLTPALGLPVNTVQWTFWALLTAFPLMLLVSWRWDVSLSLGVTEGAQALHLARSPSLAVLPFRDVSPDRDQAHLGDGIADELTAVLASVPGLGVTSRPIAFATRMSPHAGDPTEALDVDTVLRGTAQRVGNRYRISADLIERGSGDTLWSREYERSTDDLVDVQANIVHEVVRHLRPSATGVVAPRMRAHSPDPRAYELYLEARYLWTRRHQVGWDRAIECYERAIALDPHYALAYAGLADVYMFRGFYLVDPPERARAHAGEAIARAFEVGREVAEVHRARAMMLTWLERDYLAAEKDFSRALELDPTDPTIPLMFAQLLAATGKREECRRMAERGRALDPTSPPTVGLAAVAHAINREGEQAIELTDTVLAREPMNFLSRYIAGTAYLGIGRPAEAIHNLEMAVQVSRRNPLMVAFLAQAYARGGNERAAQELLSSLRATVPEERYPFGAQAAALAALGDMDGAARDMPRAIERREAYMFISASAPVFDPLRSHADYAAWMRGLGLPVLEDA